MFGLTTRNFYPVSTYNPFREMEELERRFFGDSRLFETTSGFRADVTDEGDHYLLEADLPGFDKKDITLELEGDVLTVRAERRSDETRKDKLIRRERTYGFYSRQYDVSNIQTENIVAKYENGVLQLTLPKKEQALPAARQIQIQ